MKLIELICTNCGAALKVEQEQKKCFCQHCGNEIFIDDEHISLNLDNGFDFGYQAEMGRLKAQQDIMRQNKWNNTEYQEKMQCSDNGKNVNKMADLILCIFLGVLGVHKFYEGKIGMGVLYFCTCGLFCIGWIVDIVNMVTGRYNY